jgi:hypothetical protein
MADVHSKETRSYNMSRIKGKNTKPEMLVRKFLHANGFRYKLHDKSLSGKPDIVLPKYKSAENPGSNRACLPANSFSLDSLWNIPIMKFIYLKSK